MEHRVQDTRRDRGRLLGSRRERGADRRLVTLSFHRKYSTLFSGLELPLSCLRRNGKDGPLEYYSGKEVHQTSPKRPLVNFGGISHALAGASGW
jgi:hypothetical protein